jgi:hypothetical protein
MIHIVTFSTLLVTNIVLYYSVKSGLSLLIYGCENSSEIDQRKIKLSEVKFVSQTITLLLQN